MRYYYLSDRLFGAIAGMAAACSFIALGMEDSWVALICGIVALLSFFIPLPPSKPGRKIGE